MSMQYIILVYPPHSTEAHAYGPVTSEDRDLLMTDYEAIRDQYPGCTIITTPIAHKTEFYHKM